MTPLSKSSVTTIYRESNILVVFSIMIMLLAWSYIFYDSLYSAVQIWYISEIFNHCFFVIPGAFYFIYRKRFEFSDKEVKPNYLLFIPLFGLLILYALGLAGDVQLFMHVATFASLPLIIWLMLGNQIAKVIAFPLVFMLFSIPIGEELIPWLQQVTADISIPLLGLTGVPTHRAGLYVEIPNGKFLIAEACSGISFFIASIVIGALYTHLNIRSVPKKCGFMLIAIVYPIIANALRVYGIILTAYLTDMEYAAGADHLIYGGVFFAIVIISLLFIGELFRDKDIDDNQPSSSANLVRFSYKLILPGAMISLMLVIFYLWFLTISQRTSYQQSPGVEFNLPVLKYSGSRAPGSHWETSYHDAELQKSDSFIGLNKQKLDLFMAYYVQGKGELVSSLNQLYKQDSWTIVSSTTASLSTGNASKPVYFEVITNSNGVKRFLASWYVINGQTFANKREAKLYQILNIMRGLPADGGVVAISQQFESNSMAEQEKQFFSDLEAVYEPFSEAFPFAPANLDSMEAGN